MASDELEREPAFEERASLKKHSSLLLVLRQLWLLSRYSLFYIKIPTR